MDTQESLLQTNYTAIPEQDGSYSIIEFINRILKQRLLIPQHQRDKVWTLRKKKQYIKRILDSNKKPIGIISTYQIIDGNKNVSPSFLNDGYQRLSTLIECYQNAELYNLTYSVVSEKIESIMLSFQHRHYLNHKEAAKDFQAMNIGTLMNPYDFYKQDLVYMNNYSSYKTIIENIISAVRNNDIEISAYPPENGETYKKGIRDIYAIIYRYLANDTVASGVKYNGIKGNTVSDDDNIEKYLSEYLEKHITINDFKRKSIELINHINDIKALILHYKQEANNLILIHNEEYQSINTEINKLNFVVWRFMLTGILILKIKNIKNEVIKESIVQFMTITTGVAKSEYIYKKQRHVINISFQKLNGFFLTLKKLDILNDNSEKPERKKKKQNNYKGQDSSHIFPVSQYGDSKHAKTFPEPSSLNRSRGSKVVGE